MALLLLLCDSMVVSGQSKNELSLHGGGGLSTLRYALPHGQYESGFGDDMGLGYTRFVSRSFGVGTGLGLSRYSAAARLDGATIFLPNLQDASGDSYDLHSELLSYREQQQATFVHIPLMVSYHGRQRHPFYAQAGVKLSIPLSARYESRNAVIRNEGYYPALDNTMQGPPFLGFGSFNGRNAEGTLDLKPVYTASAEAGVKWKFLRTLSLYAGLFIDYGLTDALRSSRSESLMHPNVTSPENFTTGSVLASRYTSDNRTIDKLSLMAAGLKLRIAFGFSPFDVHRLSVRQIQEDSPHLVQERKEAAQVQQLKAVAEAKQQRETNKAQRQKFEEELQHKVTDIRLQQQRQEEVVRVKTKKTIEQPVAAYIVSQTEPTPDQKSDMDRKAMLLKQNPSFKVICVGHTCDIGSEKINYRISRERAMKAKDYLVQQGVDESRISILGKGSRHPLVPNTSEKNRRVNRRVEILIVEE